MGENKSYTYMHTKIHTYVQTIRQLSLNGARSPFFFWSQVCFTHTYTHTRMNFSSFVGPRYCDLQNNCSFDRPLKNAWMRGIPIQGPFFLYSCVVGIKKGGPKSFRNGRSNLQLFASRSMCYTHTYTHTCMNFSSGLRYIY